VSRQNFIIVAHIKISTELSPLKAALPHADTDRQTNGQNEAFRSYASAPNYSELYGKVQFVPHIQHGMLPLEKNNGLINVTQIYVSTIW